MHNQSSLIMCSSCWVSGALTASAVAAPATSKCSARDSGIAVDVDYAKEVGCTQGRPGKLLLAAWRAVCIAYLWTDHHY